MLMIVFELARVPAELVYKERVTHGGVSRGGGGAGCTCGARRCSASEHTWRALTALGRISVHSALAASAPSTDHVVHYYWQPRATTVVPVFRKRFDLLMNRSILIELFFEYRNQGLIFYPLLSYFTYNFAYIV